MINPALLIDEPIRVMLLDKAPSGALGPALVQQIDNGFAVTVYRDMVQKMAESSNVNENILILGLLYHEVAHIKYDSFKRSSMKRNDSLAHWVDNLVEDTRIEYSMSYDYPYVARYIALAVLASKDKIIAEALTDDSEISKASSALLKMIRVGIMPDDMDEEFIEFMMPRILLARRSNRTKSTKIANEITNYLQLLTDDPDQLAMQDFVDKSGEGECQEDQEGQDNQDGQPQEGQDNQDGQPQEGQGSGKGRSQQEEGTGQQEGSYSQDKEKKIEQLKKQLSSFNPGGKGAGSQEQELIDEVIGADDYVRNVLARNSSLIKKVNKAFSEIFTKNAQCPVKEGDVNLKRQQQIYMNSFSGEEDYDYNVNKRQVTAFDCVILRDISGSIGANQKPYAEATCVLAKALEELSGVKIAIIDFNSNTKLLKTFATPLMKIRIKPHTSGGTSLLTAMKELENIPFRQKKKLIIIITDGSPDATDETIAYAKETKSKYTYLPIVFSEKQYSSYHSRYNPVEIMRLAFGDVEEIIELEDLHKAVHKLIKKKVF